MDLNRQILARARRRKRCIGIGLIRADDEIISGLEESQVYADVRVVGIQLNGYQCTVSSEPNTDLVCLLKSGDIDGAVRGNLDHRPAIYEQLKEQFCLNPICRCSLIKDAQGREFFFGPTGLNEGLGRNDKLAYINEVINFMETFEITPRIGLLSRRDDDVGINAEADGLYEDAEQIQRDLQQRGYQVEHFANEVERAIPNSNCVVPPNGMLGNFMSHTFRSQGASLLALPVLTAWANWLHAG
jgi:predicted methyltransferase MtxX (methanogen marker protein 4)